MKKMTFGKHKGETLEWIADNHPRYIVWLDENDVMEVPEDILERAQDEIDHEDDMYSSYMESRHGDWGNRD